MISFQKHVVIFAIGITISAALLLAYFNVHRLIKYIQKTTWGAKILKVKQPYNNSINLQSLILGISLALLRYMTYTIQYMLLLYVCGISLSPFHVTCAIAVIFLIQTGMPMPASLSLLARGNVAIFILCLNNVNSPQSILLATGLLWLINVVIPAIFGAWILLRK